MIFTFGKRGPSGTHEFHQNILFSFWAVGKNPVGMSTG